ncbi:hypothetical protein [Burkholderia gladioli]|uniref:hypothetical protein n=2 Tax=Burkholderia gladioli TaxID=28095 RepID=UPI00163F7D2A|nr:hypothetical protein [Burkholderia gladioli]
MSPQEFVSGDAARGASVEVLRSKFERYLPAADNNGGSVVQTQERPNTVTMNTPTREELDAKLELIEVKMDGRVASIEGKIDKLLQSIDAAEALSTVRTRAAESHMALFDVKVDQINQRFSAVEGSVSAIQSASQNLKYWLIGTGIAVVLGIAAFNATVLSNMVASFESGKNTATSLSQTAEQLKDVQEQITKVQDALKRQPQAPTTSPPSQGKASQE